MNHTKEERATYNKVYYKKNQDRIDKKNKAWRATNKEKDAEYGKKYRDNNPDKITERIDNIMIVMLIKSWNVKNDITLKISIKY